MQTYSMTCTCGHVTTVDAENRAAAVLAMQDMMTSEAIAQHMAEKHKPEDPVPSVEETHASIEANLEPKA